MLDRLRSAYHGWSLAVSERTAHVRGPRPETPAGRLPSLPAEAEHRIGTLQRRYGVAFEQRLGARSALQNYEYLDWLDAAFAAWDLAPPRPAELHDVGCGGFAYCHALQSFFAPVRLVGIDVEGHRRLRGGVNRRERVLGHLVDVPSAEFVVADYTRWSRRADFVTTFFPFVTPALLLASHSAAEHATAAEFARAAGFVRVAVVERPRLAPATPGEPPVVLSLWQADGRAQDEGA